MLHDLIGVSKEELDEFLSNVDNHLILSGGIWRHRKRAPIYASVKLDKYFDGQFKTYVRLKHPQTGAFARKRIFDLLEAHRVHHYVLVADIKKYFESIAYKQIVRLLADSPELLQHAEEIKKVYFYNKYLRRGMIASSAISEVVGLKIDAIVKKLIYEAGLKSAHYSRYYDDISISADNKVALEKLQAKLALELKEHLDLVLNQKKTKIRQLSGTKILGLSFHEGEITPPKAFKLNLRAAEHRYCFMNEVELEDVAAKMSQVGTIYASYHRIVNSSSVDTSSLNGRIRHYHDELYRLHELYEHLLRQRYEEMNS